MKPYLISNARAFDVVAAQGNNRDFAGGKTITIAMEYFKMVRGPLALPLLIATVRNNMIGHSVGCGLILGTVFPVFLCQE